MGTKKYDWTKAVPQFTEKVIRNFWKKVQQGEANACWPWTASRFTDEYGCFMLPFDDGRHRARKASKVAWAIANGQWPSETEPVMHLCDDTSSLNKLFGKMGYRRCCNPRHLQRGTNDQNMARMADTARAAQGDEHWTRQRPADVKRGASVGNSKFRSDNDVLVVRVAFLWAAATNWPINAKGQGLGMRLAAEFGVTSAMISQVKLGKWWAHVDLSKRLVYIIEAWGFPRSLEDLVTRSKWLVGASEEELCALEATLPK